MWEISYQPSPAALKLNHADAYLTLLIISRSQMTAPLHFPFIAMIFLMLTFFISTTLLSSGKCNLGSGSVNGVLEKTRNSP